MLIREVMNKNAVVGKPEVTLKEACEVMSQLHIGCLIIFEKEKILGIITERDIIRAIARGIDVNATLVEEVMSKNVVTIEPDKTVEDAVELMTKNSIKRLPVVKDSKIMGVITASDIIVVEPKLIEAVANLLSIKLPAYRGG